MYLFVFCKHDVYKHIQAQVWKGFFMWINYLCISYVLFVDIFTRSFDDLISMKFLIAVSLPASLFIPTSPRLLTLEIFANLRVYYFGRNLLASPFILPSPSIWNSKVFTKWSKKIVCGQFKLRFSNNSDIIGVDILFLILYISVANKRIFLWQIDTERSFGR